MLALGVDEERLVRVMEVRGMARAQGGRGWGGGKKRNGHTWEMRMSKAGGGGVSEEHAALAGQSELQAALPAVRP